MKYLWLLMTLSAVTASALTLPKNIYKNPTITPESSYETFKSMRDAKKLYKKGSIKDASPLFIRILLKANKNKKSDKNIDQYDYLYAHLAILAALEHEEKDAQTYKKLAKKILSFLDNATKRGIWEEGELGQLQLLMYRHIGNTLADKLYQESKRKDKKMMKSALFYAKKAEKYIRDESDFYIKDTVAKISNALEGNPPLKTETGRLTIRKIIKKTPQKEEEKKESEKLTKKLPQT